MPKTKVKQPKFTEPFWASMVSTYLLFMELKIGKKVPLEDSAPRDVKAVVKRLRERANESHIAWTKDVGVRTFNVFLNFAWDMSLAPRSDKWFIVRLNQRKEEILEAIHQYKISKQNNDKN